MVVNLELLLKAQADAQMTGRDFRPDFTGYRLAIVKREVVSRFARAYRRAFYEGEIVIAIPTTARMVTAWSMANRCNTVLPAGDVVWLTPAAVTVVDPEVARLAPIDARD